MRRVILAILATLTLTWPLSSAAQRSTATIGIYADPQGMVPCATIEPGTHRTLFVIAKVGGNLEVGITGAVFRVVVSHPEGWAFAYTPPAAAVTNGSPMDLHPENEADDATPPDVAGLDLIFTECQLPSANGLVPLGTIEAISFTGGPTNLTLQRHDRVIDRSGACPLVRRCDAPAFTPVCIQKSTEPPCEGPALSPSIGCGIQDEVFFVTQLNGGVPLPEPPREPPPHDPNVSVIARFAAFVLDFPEGQVVAPLEDVVIHSLGIQAVLEKHGVTLLVRVVPPCGLEGDETSALYFLIVEDPGVREALVEDLRGHGGVLSVKLDEDSPIDTETPYPLSVKATVGRGQPTRFTIGMPDWTSGRLVVYDVRGRPVRTVYDGPLNQGRTILVWRNVDDGGARVSTGIYFARLTVGNRHRTTKFVVVR